MKELSDTEREVLAFVASCIDEHGHQPSYKEIAKRFGWQSPAYCTVVFANVSRKGHAKRYGGRALRFDWKSHLNRRSKQ